MGKMCIGCSPQLIEGICPDSKAGKIVAELVGALQRCVDLMDHEKTWSIKDQTDARVAIAKVTGRND